MISSDASARSESVCPHPTPSPHKRPERTPSGDPRLTNDVPDKACYPCRQRKVSMAFLSGPTCCIARLTLRVPGSLRQQHSLQDLH